LVSFLSGIRLVGEDEIPAAEQLLLGLCDHPSAGGSAGPQIRRQGDAPHWTVHLLGPERPDTHLRKFIIPFGASS